jgi:hypothetical protein
MREEGKGRKEEEDARGPKGRRMGEEEGNGKGLFSKGKREDYGQKQPGPETELLSWLLLAASITYKFLDVKEGIWDGYWWGGLWVLLPSFPLSAIAFVPIPLLLLFSYPSFTAIVKAAHFPLFIFIKSTEHLRVEKCYLNKEQRNLYTYCNAPNLRIITVSRANVNSSALPPSLSLGQKIKGSRFIRGI